MEEMTLKEAALFYAQQGLAVFPLKPRSKQPATNNGFKAATTDPDRIAEWWDQYPDSNVGIATGKVSGGLVVIDLDIDEDKGKNGYEVLKDWQREHGALQETAMVITGRGGYHYYYRDSGTWRNRTGLYEGVDVRGDGGYVVAPPSVHENGRRYEWEQDLQEYGIAAMDQTVIDFLMPVSQDSGKEGFQVPDEIPEGQRTSTLVKLVCSQQAKGLSDEAIRAAVRAENEARCVPPLTDEELEKTVFPALTRYRKGNAPYCKAVPDKGVFRPMKSYKLSVDQLDNIEEQTPEWLVLDYIPKYQITTLAGDGGAGKTTVWCALAAAISSGKRTFFESFLPEDWGNGEGKKVMYFSSEDSTKYTLRRRLRKNGANLKNIITIGIDDERFREIKFNSPFLEQLLNAHRPALCIFDPIQAFVPPDIKMGDRNAMRQCLGCLLEYGEKYGTTFLIVAHANKQSGVWGRKRIADSADVWDLSRSVLMAGETNEKGVRYLSHEKSNYGPLGGSILYTIDDDVVHFKAYSNKRDKDFITEVDYSTRQAPQRDEAKDFILEFLKDGEKEVAELDAMANAQGITKGTLTRAKSELKKDGKIRYRNSGSGRSCDKKFYIGLIASE